MASISSIEPPPIAVARDPVALVVQECITVTGAMRKHARWAHSSVSAILGGASAKPVNAGRASLDDGNLGDDEEAQASRWGLRGKKGKSMVDNPLLSAFARLRGELKGCKDIRSFDTPSLLHPFLQVIRSSSTSASITSLALNAITKFLSYNIIAQDSPRLPLAMQLLSSAITHCRFEASDSAADEIVLLRILRLMERMVSGPGIGDILSDESVCEIMETGLSMCCQVRLSELLRRNAEISMVTMCQVIFERLKHLEVEAGDELHALDENTKDDMETVKMDPSVNGNTLTQIRDGEGHTGSDSPALGTEKNASQMDLSTTVKEESEEAAEIKPYSLPSIRELFRVLVDLLDPNDKQRTDTMRVMALRIVDVALEVAGPSIANHPSLASLAKDTLCRHLFQLVRSESMAILNESLRVAGTLLATCRGVLKLQQELFLSYIVACLFPKVEIPQEPGIDPKLYEGVPQAPGVVKPAASQPSSGRATPVPVKDRQRLGLEGGSRKPDAREAMVESIGALVKIPSFMAELFVNYDCEIDRSDLCVDMVGLLSRNAFPDSATWSTTNVPPLCLDALLGYVQSIADRLDDPVGNDATEDVKRLKRQRELKKIISKGASRFNESPKSGIAYLASQGIIDNVDNPKSIAEFVGGTTRVDKKVLGEYLAKKDNVEILRAYMESFDFSGQRVDEALRQLLYSFRLPGESQLIERIVTEFSEQYCAKVQPESIADKDACFVLTYSIIMLNVDQHSPKVKSQSRMSVTDFTKNLRGVNNGSDFPIEYLQEIYDAIRTAEIILPEEHNSQDAYDHAWKELLVKVQSATDMIPCDSNAFDAEMFAATWRPIVATLTYVFMSASDDTVFNRVITGFDQCAKIASKYQLTDAMDQLVFCLASISTLATDAAPDVSLNTEVQTGEKNVMVSKTAVTFGREYKAQLATVVLFRVVTGHESAIRGGWVHLVRIMLNLFINALIPPSFNSISKTIDVPPIPLQPPTQVIERENRSSEAGLFSAFTQYVTSFANDEPPEPSDQEIEYTLITVDCVNACGFDEIFANISRMPVDSLKPLLTSLLLQIPEDMSPRVIVVKPDLPPPSPARPPPNGPVKVRHGATGPAYNPQLVFVLELCTIIALRDEQTIEVFGKDIADALQTIIRDAANYHPSVTSRAVYYLLALLNASANAHDFIRAPVVLHHLSSFPQELLEQSAMPLLRGLSDCINGPAPLRSEVATSPDFWSILRSLATAPDASAAVFKIAEDLVTREKGVGADNYEAIVTLLNDFATAGSVGAYEEQRRDASSRDGRDKGKGGEKRRRKSKNEEAVIRGVNAVGLIWGLIGRVQAWIEGSHLEREKAWTAYWSPIFQTLTTQSLNPCRAIRSTALASLQRCLLSETLTSIPLNPEKDGEEYVVVFNNVLFPLITQLLKPEVYQSDPGGMGDSRVQTASLCGRVFLQYLDRTSATDEPREENELISIWTRILSVMERLMTSSSGDNVEEAITQQLKNILLVMNSKEYLVPPEQDERHAELWRETWRRLDRFLPGLFAELFPEEAKNGPPWKIQSPTRTVAPEPKQMEQVQEGEEKGEEVDEKAPEVEPKADDVD
ncbi:Sec7-domain-containing protein [Rhizodiscina lignyota]|uniref:Sec7-domain-containing protein n=1 Tax=Rhizodiscina lignyota TaxID=1504668 RepID=A0A9P4IQP0_9PEZI|nr:Sec7-domain-containing protein [Rhizodiscina lignyota]